MSAREEWPIESEHVFSAGKVTCTCGETFDLYWNSGELDEHNCSCGRFYRTEHRSTVLVVRRPDSVPADPAPAPGAAP